MARTTRQPTDAWPHDEGRLDYEDDEDDEDDWPDELFDALWDDDDWEPPPPGGWPCHA
jgi:hypothetical protein